MKGVPLPFHQPDEEDGGELDFQGYFANSVGGEGWARVWSTVPLALGKLQEL